MLVVRLGTCRCLAVAEEKLTFKVLESANAPDPANVVHTIVHLWYSFHLIPYKVLVLGAKVFKIVSWTPELHSLVVDFFQGAKSTSTDEWAEITYLCPFGIANLLCEEAARVLLLYQ